MKLKELRQIIREELEKSIKEGFQGEPEENDELSGFRGGGKTLIDSPFNKFDGKSKLSVNIDIPAQILKVMEDENIAPAFRRNLVVEYITQLLDSEEDFNIWLSENQDIMDDHM